VTIGIAPAVLNGWLDALCRGVNYGAPVAFWVKLHTGDPGASGTANPALNTTRQQATFGTTASAGSITTTTDLNWTATNAEAYSHVSFWSASSGGSFLGSDDLTTPRPVAVADAFMIPAGSLTVAVAPVAV
jgi:hypothetical protein